MPLYHRVKRGDNLWSLAHRHLGDGTRWPEIFTAHNTEAAKPTQQNRLLPIADENLIYVGQTIVLPPRKKNPGPGTGTKAAASIGSLPLDLKVTYSIGRDTPPIIYTGPPNPDVTIKTELSGEISLEIASDNMRRHSLELLLSKDSLQAKQKLHAAYDPALCALTAKPTMVFESGRVKINAPLATEANVGPYTISVQAIAPNHLAGTIKPQTLAGTVKVGQGTYKFSADIELKAEVIVHPRTKGMAKEPVPNTTPQNIPANIPTDNGIKWPEVVEITGKIATVVAVTILTLLAPQVRFSMASGTSTAILPFNHTIDPRSHGYPGEA